MQNSFEQYRIPVSPQAKPRNVSSNARINPGNLSYSQDQQWPSTENGIRIPKTEQKIPKNQSPLNLYDREIFETSNDTIGIKSEDNEKDGQEEHEQMNQQTSDPVPNNQGESIRPQKLMYQLTETKLNVPKSSREISCQCDTSQFNLIKKKSGSSIELEEDCKFNKNGRWTRTKFMLTKEKLAFIEASYTISDISKIKIFPVNKATNEQVIKIQVGDNQSFFSMDNRKRHLDLPLPFFMYAKLIIKKLEALAVQSNNSWDKTEHIQKSVMMDSYIFGEIYKRSQHFGVWSKRYVVIKNDGIYSYRDYNREQQYSFFIPKTSVKYIWSRLELESGFLVLKIKHGFAKTEFAIPVNNFACRGCKNWLFDFYRMLI